MRWMWNAEKNRRNKANHSIRFETAQLVFGDPMAATPDDSHPDRDRWQTIGVVGSATIFVIHTWPEKNRDFNEPVGRIISARRATKGRHMKKAASDHLTTDQRAELDALAAMPEEAINTKDIPEQRDWSGAKRGLFYRPVKQQITLRLDSDLIDWFRRHPKPNTGYQTAINHALREYVARQGRD